MAAESDLAEIWACIALEASERTATRIIDAIKAAFDQLLVFPLSGPARGDLAPNLRLKFHRAYAIYYTPSARELVIIRVLHGARDVASIAARGGFLE